MQAICQNHWCKQGFEIAKEDISFYEEISPMFNGRKELIPPPKLCPDCRQQRRLSYRNAHVLYKRKCDLTGQMIISVYSPDKDLQVMNQPDFWSDKWDPLSYGVSFSPSKPFFEQLKELRRVVPRIALSNLNAENSEYVAIGGDNKNCYMASPCFQSEDCYFGDSIYSCRNVIDCLLCENLEIAYECINCKNGYALFFSQDCFNCRNSFFLKDCISCQDCIGCFSLRNQRFHVFNKPLKEEEYRAVLRNLTEPLTHGKIVDMRNGLQAEELQLPHVAFHEVLSENCSGDYFIECRNCRKSYDLKRCEDVKYCTRVFDAKDSYDLSKCGVQGLEWCYELMNAGYIQNHVLFSHAVWNSADCSYCDHCRSCRDCFGCVSLHHKQYCILNKQYSKEEYEKLAPKIVEHMRKSGEWGEFLPVAMSPFSYNETVAQEYFPLTKEEVRARGWSWQEEHDSHKDYLGPKVDVPDSIIDIPDDFTNRILTCETTGKLYKVIPQELAFCRQNKLPLPRRCPDRRHLDRLAMRRPRKMWNRTCAKCQRPIATTYSPDRPEIVYCERCYLEAVY